MSQCAATTKAGKPCRARAVEGKTECPMHLGTNKGRPTKLDEEMQLRILTAVRAGNYPSVAIKMAGLSHTAFASYKERGEAGQEPFASFIEALEKARAEGETALVARIARAGHQGSWQANAWILERQYPDRWGRRERHEHTGRDGGPITFDVEKTLADEKAREAADRFLVELAGED